MHIIIVFGSSYKFESIAKWGNLAITAISVIDFKGSEFASFPFGVMSHAEGKRLFEREMSKIKS